jgi:hypothetical protein
MFWCSAIYFSVPTNMHNHSGANSGSAAAKPPLVHVRTIQPFPGFVIKTRGLAADEKLFINVFHHFEINEGEDNYYDSILARSFPFSVHDRVVVTDKKGEPCVAYGIAIPTVLFERNEQQAKSKEEVCFISCVSCLLACLLICTLQINGSILVRLFD